MLVVVNKKTGKKTKIMEQFREKYVAAGWVVEGEPKSPEPASEEAKAIAKGIDAEKAANARGESKTDKNRLADAIAKTELSKSEPDKFNDGLFGDETPKDPETPAETPADGTQAPETKQPTSEEAKAPAVETPKAPKASKAPANKK